MAPGHIGVGLSFGRCVAEVAPAINHLFWRATADTQLQSPTGNNISGTCVLRHVQRILVAHIDHRCADFDALGSRANCGQERERRAELPCEVMDAKIRPISPQLFGRDGKIN